MKMFASGRLSPDDCLGLHQDLGAAKKNELSITTTVSHLSNLSHTRYLDTAAGLIQHHKTTMKAFIRLGSEPGLILYSSTQASFIMAFRHNSKAFIGVTKANLTVQKVS
jgi:hypothetical protein